MRKFILFASLFLVFELVVSAGLDKNIEKFPLIGYQVDRFGDDNLPRLNCSIDSYALNGPKYEVFWDVQVYRADSTQMLSAARNENIENQQIVDLVKKISSRGTMDSGKLAAGQDDFTSCFDYQGSSLLTDAKRSTLVFEKWPDKKDKSLKGYVYKVKYKIDEWKKQSEDGDFTKVPIANFSFTIGFYWNPLSRNVPMVQITTDGGRYNSTILRRIEFLPVRYESGNLGAFLIKLVAATPKPDPEKI